jgi:hypothetical protein
MLSVLNSSPERPSTGRDFNSTKFRAVPSAIIGGGGGGGGMYRINTEKEGFMSDNDPRTRSVRGHYLT